MSGPDPSQDLTDLIFVKGTVVESVIQPGDDFHVSLHLRNEGWDPISLDHIRLKMSGYRPYLRERTVPPEEAALRKEVGPGEDLFLVLRATVIQERLHDRRIEYLPPKLEVGFYRVAPPAPHQLLATYSVPLTMDPYVKWLMSQAPVNILMWGPIGSGKSQFISSAYSVVNPNMIFSRAVSSYAMSMASSESVTQMICRYIPGKKTNAPREVPLGLMLSMTDSFGWETRTDAVYSSPQFLRALFQGRIPSNDEWNIARCIQWVTDGCPESELPPAEATSIITALLIAVNPTAVEDPGFKKKILNFAQTAAVEGLVPLLLLTSIDTDDASHRTQFDPVKFEKLKEQIIRELGVTDVIPVCNYVDEDERTFNLDKMIFSAIYRAHLHKRDVSKEINDQVYFESVKAAAAVDKFDNPIGRDYDYGKEHAFGAYSIILFNPSSEVHAFDEAITALADKGMRLLVARSEEEFLSELSWNDECWFLSHSSNNLSQTPKLQFIEALTKFHRSGRGICVWADNDPWYAHANLFLQAVFGPVQLVGNTPGNRLLKPGNGSDTGTFVKGHPLTQGIETLHEGITICYPRGRNPLLHSLATSTDGNTCIMYCDAPERGRVVIDTGFTKMYSEFFNTTAGNDRYVRNVAVWLLGIDERLAKKLPLKGPIY